MTPFEELEKQFRQVIDEAWVAFEEMLAEGEYFQDAQDEYYNILEDAILEFHQKAFELGQMEASPTEGDRPPGLPGFSEGFPRGVFFQLERLRKFLDELETAYDVTGTITSFKARALSYAGAIWNPYQRGRIYYDPPGTKYIWVGVDIPGGGDVDSRTCPGCEWQVKQPPRTLDEMDKLPGEEECGVRCRHGLEAV